MVLARHAVHFTAQADRDVAQAAVVHVHHAGEDHPARVDAERVALLHVVVQHGAEQVVRGGDGVHVAGKVQVDVLHRHNLRIAAAGRAALDAEYRTEGRLAQRDHRVFAELCHRLTEADGRGGLALARGGGVDGGDEHQLAVFTALQLGPHVCGQLGLVLAVQLQVVRVQSGGRGDFRDRAHLAALRDFDIG